MIMIPDYSNTVACVQTSPIASVFRVKQRNIGDVCTQATNTAALKTNFTGTLGILKFKR